MKWIKKVINKVQSINSRCMIFYVLSKIKWLLLLLLLLFNIPKRSK